MKENQKIADAFDLLALQDILKKNVIFYFNLKGYVKL